MTHYTKYLGVGLQLAATVISGVFIGYYLDRKFQTIPVWTLIGSFLGMLVGFVNLVFQMKKNGGQ